MQTQSRTQNWTFWTLKIQDPSGETRRVALRLDSNERISNPDALPIELRDPSVRRGAVTFETRGGNLWIVSQVSGFHFEVGNFATREAAIPASTPVRIGETSLQLEEARDASSLPSMPHNVRAWLTTAESGRKVLWDVKRSAETPLSIYLAGETGTGKEVLAQLIHSWSPRAAGPFVPLHCGALAQSLAESELFGHTKGAFTGAHSQRAGALMQAHNGTLFLDEVGDLPMDMQVKLLRFLENGEIRPVGADRCSHADVRIICATHLPLEELVEKGRFRRDLYYRLASVTILIPTLRDRPEDIALLAKRFASDLGRGLSSRALLRLQAHAWPGNVRELRHAIERASGLSGPFCTVLGEENFEFLITPKALDESPNLELGSAILTLAEMERVLVLKALKISRGNRSVAAKILGVARSTLFEMLKRHKIMGPKAREWDYVDAEEEMGVA